MEDGTDAIDVLRIERERNQRLFEINAARARTLLQTRLADDGRADLEVYIGRMRQFHSIDEDISNQLVETLKASNNTSARDEEEIATDLRQTEQMIQINRAQRMLDRCSLDLSTSQVQELLTNHVEDITTHSLLQPVQAEQRELRVSPNPARLQVPSPLSVQASVFHPNAQSSTPAIQAPNQPRFQARRSRLPVLEIPKFSGKDIREWTTFWERFESEVDADEAMSGATKCTYLLSFLEDRAKDLVRGISPSSTNYGIIIDLLKSHFGNDDKIRDAHIKAIETLQPPRNTYDSLFKFYTSFTSDIRALEAFKFTDDGFEGIYIAKKLMDMLPNDVANEILRFTQAKTPTLREFSSQLLVIIQRMEYLQSSKVAPQPKEVGSVTSLPTKVEVKPGHQYQRGPKPCVYCTESHGVMHCTADLDTKLKAVTTRKLCFNCLNPHKASQCRSKYKCKTCSQLHHTTLHEHFVSKAKAPEPRPAAETASLCSVREAVKDGLVSLPVQVEKGTLKTAITRASWGTVEKPCHVFIDEGSELSFIKQKYAQLLGIKAQYHLHLRVKGFGDHITEEEFGVCQIHLHTRDGHTIPASLIITEDIVNAIDRTELLEAPELEELRQLDLADPLHSASFPVDVLIGSNLKWDIQTTETIKLPCGLVAQSSKLGWLLSGKLKSIRMQDVISSVTIGQDDDLPLREQVERLISIDSMDLAEKDETPEEYLEEFKSKIEYREGQYYAPLTWKKEHPPLPSNFGIAKKRLMSITNRLVKEKLFHHYSKLIQEQLELQFIEEVNDDPFDELNSHYLAHFYTLRDSETTPIRIVFAANAGKVSLNDCVEKGMCLLQDLVELIHMFRSNKYAFVADIAKAFLRIKLKEGDRNFVKFLWWENDKPFSRIKVYRYCSVLFGPAGSPFTLGSVLLVHLNKYDTPVARDMKEKLYCDNLLSGTMDKDNVVPYYQEARKIMADADMNLRQWVTNDENLNLLITEEKTQSKSRVTTLLGLTWDSVNDMISLPPKSLQLSPDKASRRGVFKMAMRTFDPVGFLSPVLMPSKSFLSKLWVGNLGWDDPLPPDLQQEWNEIAKEIELTTEEFKIERFLGFDPDTPVETITFTDASSQAAACVLYFRQGSAVKFSGSKVKTVSRKMTFTIPRLELIAMVIGVRYTSRIKSHYSKIYTFSSSYFCTDSEISLYWLHSSKPLKQFISKRVGEILTNSSLEDWSHQKSEDNVADQATRIGCSAATFLSSCWITGPPWLSNHKFEPWQPKSSPPVEVINLVAEVEVTTAAPETEGNILELIKWENYRDYCQLLNVLKCVVKAKTIFKTREPPLVPDATVIEQVEIDLLQAVQADHFQEEIDFLRNKNGGKRPQLVRTLGLFLHESDGLLRAAGRLQHASLDPEAKSPILLPRKTPLVRLIVVFHHVKNCHCGVNQTVASLRTKFWVPAARQQALQILRSCVQCRRAIGRQYLAPPPPPLPEFRLTGAKPFSSIGIDFSGHIFIKSDSGTRKTYLLLLTCCHTRAVSLELVSDMTTHSFLLAFRRHCAIFGVPSLIVCDNAPSFSRANEELDRILSDDEVRMHLGSNRITFKHIPVKAAWMGGFYERFIGICKSHLRKVIGKALLGYDQLYTLVKEVQAVINDRPITTLSSDVNDPLPLTPSMLLGGHKITPLPVASNPGDLDFGARDDLLQLNRQRDELRQRAFQRFQVEYLPVLREQHCRKVGNRHYLEIIQVGDIVLIHDQDRPRLQWKLGRVQELHRGTDGHVRSATVRTQLGVTRRAVHHLYPLEVQSSFPRDENSHPQQHSPEPDVGTGADTTELEGHQSVPARPRRRAAMEALQKLKEVESEDSE